MKEKKRILGDFVFEKFRWGLNPSFSVLDKSYVCDGCKKYFTLDELFRNYEAMQWFCDSCLKKKERKNESRKNR